MMMPLLARELVRVAVVVALAAIVAGLVFAGIITYPFWRK